MLFKNGLNRQIRIHQVISYLGESQVIKVLGIGDPHVLLEEVAEVLFLETGNLCDLLKAYGGGIVVVQILQDILYSPKGPVLFLGLLHLNFSGKVVIYLEKEFKDQGIESQDLPIGLNLKDDLHLLDYLNQLKDLGPDDGIVAPAVKAKAP